MEGVQARVQEGVNKLLNGIDKDCLRKIQADMFRCSVQCCETSHYNMEDVQRCLEKCSEPAVKGQNFVQGELQSFQNRLQRCAMDCQDSARDKISPGTSEADVSKVKAEMEKCVCKCADKHIDMLPGMMKRMTEVLKQGNYGAAS